MNALTTIVDGTASWAIAEAGNISGSNVWVIAITVLGFSLFIGLLGMVYKAFNKKG